MLATQRDSKIELLSPAGDLEAGYAAMYFGANAIYLGLRQFSARAEAGNLSAEELGEITAYAHSMTPRRRVFVAVNTLVQNHELGSLVETLDTAADCGVDALIVQDLGVARIARECFPNLALHASTQMAIHNVQGAKALRELGFRRVTLARELTIEEIREIAAESGIEVEVFIHGALCYSYSGLCLFSSQMRQRSGNRGRCTYPCRDEFKTKSHLFSQNAEIEDDRRERGRKVFPFSMKDLALPEYVEALRDAGVASLKIEGRMKNPLYVAATTRLYRGILDGTLSKDERAEIEEDVRTIFSRPWTKLYAVSSDNRDVVDSETVGHRGACIGVVEAFICGRRPPRPCVAGERDCWETRSVSKQSLAPAGQAGRGRDHGANCFPDKLRFKTSRAIERHDGIQIDVPGQGKPYGFAVEQLLCETDGRKRSVFEAPAGSMVEVELPEDHPGIPPNAALYCSSSQAVKRRYKYTRPKSGEFKARKVMDISAILEPGKLSIMVVVHVGPSAFVKAGRDFTGTFEQSRNPKAMEEAFRSVFLKLGDTNLELGKCELSNTQGLFIPVSRLNLWRREICKEVTERIETERLERISAMVREYEVPAKARRVSPGKELVWSIKTDRFSHLASFGSDDWKGIAEVIVDISTEPTESLLAELEKLEDHVGRDRIRLALPIITRRWEVMDLQARVKRLLADGWSKWEAGNVSALEFLRTVGSGGNPSGKHQTCFDLATDWSVYVLNRSAALEVQRLGVGRFVLSPEDGIENMVSLVSEFGEKATVIAYQDTPLFISESCPKANIGKCKEAVNKSVPSTGGLRFRAAAAEQAEASASSPREKLCPPKSGKEEQWLDCAEPMNLTSSGGEDVVVVNRGCRAITICAKPFCIVGHLKKLIEAGAASVRADFIWRGYQPEEVVEVWRLLRQGLDIRGTRKANILRGLA